MKDISVIIPIYNAEAFLARCLDSILDEKMISMEVILINDGSYDATSNICEYYQNQDSRIIYISQNNSGAVAARNKGIEIACGNYLLFVDADDYVSKGYVSSLYQTILLNSADIAFCQVHRMQFEKLIEATNYEAGIRESLSERLALLQETYYPGPYAKIYRRDLLESNNIQFLSEEGYYGFAEDMLFSLYTTYYSCKIVLCQDAVYYYCMDNEKSICANPFIQQRNNDDRIVIIRHMLHFIDDKKLNNNESQPIFNAVQNHLRWGGEYVMNRFMAMINSWNISDEIKKYFYKYFAEFNSNKNLLYNIKNRFKFLLLNFSNLYYIVRKIKRLLS